MPFKFTSPTSPRAYIDPSSKEKILTLCSSLNTSDKARKNRASCFWRNDSQDILMLMGLKKKRNVQNIFHVKACIHVSSYYHVSYYYMCLENMHLCRSCRVPGPYFCWAPAYVSICQHTSAYVRFCLTYFFWRTSTATLMPVSLCNKPANKALPVVMLCSSWDR